MTVIGLDRSSEVAFPVLSGRLPTRADEVAVGATTASGRGIGVGDDVTISGPIPTRTATVTGIVVFPALGPFEADRVGGGTGLPLTEAMVGPQLGAEFAEFASFVGVTMRGGTEETAAQRVLDKLTSIDRQGGYVFRYSDPVRPPEIVDARSIRSVPVGVGAAFAAVTAVGLGFASWTSVRSRAKELAVLRTIGFTGRQVRRSVRLQSLTTVGAAMAVGVPLGVITGRVLWRSFANQLGVVPDHAGPALLAVTTVAGGLALAVIAAQVPAVIAARARPADGLRRE
ncbi:MAG: ABC transporter permease [Acidimicrobiales bacterium]